MAAEKGLVVREKPLPIEDYALIGDGKTAALVGKDGSIDWLCLPRFDSPACFAALLGASGNGHWLIAPSDQEAKIKRFYRGDTLILETVFTTKDGEVAVIDAMPLEQENSHIIRRVEGRKGRVNLQFHIKVRFNYGVSTPWVTREDENNVIAVVGPDLVTLNSPVKLRGEGLASVANFDVEEGQNLTFTLSHGQSHLPPPKQIDSTKELVRTEQIWNEWSARCTYNGSWRKEVIRSLITLKALVYLPTGGIVAAPTTSLPEKIGGTRNWDYRYCWLRDSTFTVIALMASGYFEEAESFGRWLHRSIAGNAEEMQIMYGVAGERNLLEWEVKWLPGYEGSAPVRIGNAASEQLQLDVFGEVMDAFHQARVGGLNVPLSAWAVQVNMLEHLEAIWRQPDDGIWEMRGERRHFVHSKVMAWVAFDRAVQDIEQYSLPGPLDRWKKVRDEIHNDVCEKGYDTKQKAFTQSYGSSELDASVLLIPVIGFLPAEDERVLSTAEAIEKALNVGGFILRYRTESGSDGLPEGEGVFLPCSFWLADNYAQQGKKERAEELFRRLLSLCNDVGLMAEEYDPRLKRQVGNFPQAFSHLSIVNTALGLSSAAALKRRSEGAQPTKSA